MPGTWKMPSSSESSLKVLTNKSEIMRYIFPFLLAFVSLICRAVTFDVDGIRYAIESQVSKEVSVAIIPKSISYPTYSTYKGDINIPEYVSFNDVQYHVIGIGAHAFSECSQLGEIRLPLSIRFIGVGAFANSNIHSISLHEGIDSIGGAAFRDCYYLTSIILPKSVKRICSGLFYGCRNLKKVVFLTEELSCIPDDAFHGCSSLEDLVFPSTIKELGSAAFMGTRKLANLEIPKSVEKIGSSCFYGCGATYLEIPDKVKELEGEMFRGSKRLKSIKLPSSLERLSKQMFRGCDSLQYIVLPEHITEIPTYCFAECFQLSKVLLPASLKKVVSNAFMNCSLSNVYLPEGTILVDNEAFYGCPIDTLYLPSTLETIGGWAFGLRNLKELVLPASIKSIGSYAFDDTQLERITCMGVSPIICEENVFKNETYLYAQLVVPNESIELYKSTLPWSSFFNISGHNLTGLTNCIHKKNSNKLYINSEGKYSDKPHRGFNIMSPL